MAIKIAIKEAAFFQERDALINLRQDKENIEGPEEYGIPALFYDGYFGRFPIMAITLMDYSFIDKYVEGGPLQSENQLRVFYQLVSDIIG